MGQRQNWEISPLIAIGRISRRVEQDGSMRIVVSNTVDELLGGGFLVRNEDIGVFQEKDYALLPQLRISIGYCFGRNWRFNVGYSVTYLDSAFRPGSFMTTDFDGHLLGHVPPIGILGNQPCPQSSVLLHGMTLGLAYNFSLGVGAQALWLSNPILPPTKPASRIGSNSRVFDGS